MYETLKNKNKYARYIISCIIQYQKHTCSAERPNEAMEKERANYMQTLKRKCSLAKNPYNQAIQAYSACAATDGRQTDQVLEKELWGGENKRTMRRKSKRVK